MKLSLATALVGLLPLAMAKSIIVYYPKGTPSSVIDDGKKHITDAGGSITYDYPSLRGFAADAPDNAVTSLSDQSPNHKPFVEDDQVVTVN
ncbi:uncharacterized protein ASPGLDRAFT_41436 [Aspergillus glaucus CBS 516.65]|uniref:Inhibitor I9 domain-containing protein n=1 Tax=Aspergillus glaucus CBS 516.65 TaxID=1160497 RepID=A0A1L9VZX3_ASPGL|nr:hypothetical protein ASPGLDRAFT_41436 [Aspergillus glaucus CBS 516.65]OJJ89455.1 hypothetical protein ASPGLDRAFT_41436 [Aspergillus glaucus CBS 516.65]